MGFVKLLCVAGATVGFGGAGALAQPRDQIRIVGSSTMFPYSQAVAEQFSGVTGNPAPVVESTGTGGGMKQFCEGVGARTPDITAASRRMTHSEFQACRSHGVESISELVVGHDGLTIAHSRKAAAFGLSRKQIFQALASEVEVDGKVVPNPYRRWSEIDASLPDIAIAVFGPPPTSGTRDELIGLVMQRECHAFPAIEALEPRRKDEVCSRMRQDGPFIEAGENDNLIVKRIEAERNALGIFGYSFLYENTDQLRPVAVEGVIPTAETIANEQYSMVRPLYIYVKNANRATTIGLNAFVKEYVSEDSLGPDGYLLERGLIALSAEQREKVRAMAAAGTELDRFN